MNELRCFRLRKRLMGSDFELGIVSNQPEYAQRLLEDGVREIQRIEDLLTEFKEDSFTSAINRMAGKNRVEVPAEVFQLLQRGLSISSLTKGYFDISVGPLKKLYKFKNQEFKMPSQKEIRKALQKIGYRKIDLDPSQQTVYLTKEAMRISFAAIGKGYAADAVLKMWNSAQLEGGYVNASGDLSAFGNNEKRQPWSIGISNPDLPEQVLLYLPLQNASMATSGDYEQHFTYKGKRYSHNINPLNGLPLTGIKSVSVISPSAELSDALATAVYAMGTRQGLSMIDQLPNTHAIVVNDNNQVFFTKQLDYEAVY